MNWVLLLVLLILGYNIIRGYRKGFLRIVYSLVHLLPLQHHTLIRI